MTSRRCDVLAVSSPGGHWVELMRLQPALDGLVVQYASPDSGRALDVPAGRFQQIPDANLRTPLRLARCLIAVFLLVMRHRPRVVLSTGAAPGLFACVFGRAIGAHVIWLDIFAGVERVTLSGRLVGHFAHLRLVQWPHLARPGGPHYKGSLL